MAFTRQGSRKAPKRPLSVERRLRRRLRQPRRRQLLAFPAPAASAAGTPRMRAQNDAHQSGLEAATRPLPFGERGSRAHSRHRACSSSIAAVIWAPAENVATTRKGKRRDARRHGGRTDSTVHAAIPQLAARHEFALRATWFGARRHAGRRYLTPHPHSAARSGDGSERWGPPVCTRWVPRASGGGRCTAAPRTYAHARACTSTLMNWLKEMKAKAPS
jgi:hypothetical protein